MLRRGGDAGWCGVDPVSGSNCDRLDRILAAIHLTEHHAVEPTHPVKFPLPSEPRGRAVGSGGKETHQRRGISLNESLCPGISMSMTVFLTIKRR